jgi:hypothetical protein
MDYICLIARRRRSSEGGLTGLRLATICSIVGMKRVRIVSHCHPGKRFCY